MKTQFPISRLCQALAVSVSGFYTWQKRQRQPSPRACVDASLQGQVRQIFQQSRGTYGSPRIHQQLRQEGHRHGRKRIARLMRSSRLQARSPRRFRPITTHSRHDQPIAPNRLQDASPPARPNQVWVTDITYLPTTEGWLYFAAVMDLYSRRIVGWAFSPSLASDLVVDALRMALLHRRPTPGLIVHSDRGVQFASAQFRRLLQDHALLSSMSRKGCCYDNAAMEAFFSSLKVELLYRTPVRSSDQTAHAVFDYIESFYNRQRRHSSLGFESPIRFEHANN